MSNSAALAEDHTPDELTVVLEDTSTEAAGEAELVGSGIGYQRRCTAIRLLREREPLLLNRQKGRQKHWAEQLSEATKAMNAEIKRDIPKASQERYDMIKAIQDAFEEHAEREREKKKDIDACKAAVEANATALQETATADVEAVAVQQQLFDETQELAKGLELTQGTLELIDAAAREVLQANPEASTVYLAAVAELATALASMKINGMHLVTPPAEAVESDGELADHAGEGDEAEEGDVPF
jgi:hypothetical protein